MNNHGYNHKFLETQNVYSYPKLSATMGRFKLTTPGIYPCYVNFKDEESEWEKLLANSFSDKASYLEWVKNWRECYKWLTQEIRHAKRNRKAYPGDNEYDLGMRQHKAWRGGDIARRMLKLRSVAKKISWRIREANREAEHVI